MKYSILFTLFCAACSPTTPTSTPVVEMPQTTQTAAQVAAPVYVEDTTVPINAPESVAGKLARSVAALKAPYGTAAQVMALLELPGREALLNSPQGSFYPAIAQPAPARASTMSVPRSFKTGTPTWTFKTDEGELKLVLNLLPGTWEPPRGNSMPRMDPPIVQSVQVSGPQRLEFLVPDDAVYVLADGDGTPHHLKIWDDFLYFEQGGATHGWTLTRATSRAPFHRTKAEQKALEDAVLAMVGPLAAGADIKVEMGKLYADKQVGDSPVYDFGSGRISLTHPGVLSVSWVGPTKVPAIFAHFGVQMLSTSFAHDAGQMSNPVELENLKLHPVDYFIREPESQEAEMGSAADASFRRMDIVYKPGQKSGVNH